MSYPDDDYPTKAQRAEPLPVKLTGFDGLYVKRPRLTTCKTWVLDPAGVNGDKFIQICTEEPTRYRLMVQAWTADIAIVGNIPRVSPDSVTGATAGPEGAYIKANDGRNPWEFFGTDALWVNSLGTITLVTVVKEYL